MWETIGFLFCFGILLFVLVSLLRLAAWQRRH